MILSIGKDRTIQNPTSKTELDNRSLNQIKIHGFRKNP